MRIKGEDLQEGQTVYVNGRRIAADIIELDTEQGWVKIEVPQLPTKAVEGKPGDTPDKMQTIGHKELKLNGNVEVKNVTFNRSTRS